MQCLPLGQQVEFLWKVTEYRLNPELEILEEWDWNDTLTLTEDSSIVVTIEY